MKYLFLFSFAFAFAFFNLELGYTATSPTWTHITYMFQHGTLVHLCINCFSFLAFFKVLERFYAPYKIAVVIVMVAFGSSFLCLYAKPVVGASGMIYAMLGMFISLVRYRVICLRNRAALYVLFLSTATFISIGFFKHNSAGLLHLLCLISGYTISSIKYINFALKPPFGGRGSNTK